MFSLYNFLSEKTLFLTFALSFQGLMDLNALGLLGLYILRGVPLADVLFGPSEDARRQNWYSTLTKIVPAPNKSALEAMGAR